jgi:glycosyltransferase involved in cell wall biosynthesis
MQRDASFDIVIVMDGSAAAFDAAYAAVIAKAGAAAQVVRLDRTARGHGQSYAINRGAACAGGNYLCFLDDDDQWSDPAYLARAAASLASAAPAVDLYLSGQDAYRGTERVAPADGVWIEALRAQPARLGPADAQGARPVAASVLMRLPRHCHLNTTIIRRALFDAIGGMDEDIRYDCDRDFYLRAVDRAETIVYSGRTVSRHNIPDPAQASNMSTATSALQRRLYQRMVFDKSIMFAQRPEVAAHARAHQAYVLRHIARGLAAAGRTDRAAIYAREALGVMFSLKWLGYCLWLTAKAWRSRR